MVDISIRKLLGLHRNTKIEATAIDDKLFCDVFGISGPWFVCDVHAFCTGRLDCISMGVWVGTMSPCPFFPVDRNDIHNVYPVLYLH